MGNDQFEAEGRANGLREFLTVVFKYKPMILAVFVGIVATVTLASFLMTPVYESESTVLLKIGREYLTRPEVGNNVPLVQLNREELTNAELQIFKDRELVGKVISGLTLEKLYPELLKNPPKKLKPIDVAVERFQKQLKVESVKKSNVIKVSFRHNDPLVAAGAVNLLIDCFKEKHLQVFSDPKSSFLETQLVAYDQKLKESENNLQAFKQKSGVFSLDEQRKLLLEQRTALDSSLKSSQSSITELQKKVATLKSHKAAITKDKSNYTNSERERIIVDAKSRLLALQLNEQELLKKYTEKNRLVVDNRKQIETVREFMKEQEVDINSKGSPVYQSTEMDLIRAETELSAQKGKSVALNQQLAEVDGKLHALDYSEKDLQKLKREQAINEKNYQTYSEKAEEARLADDMNRLKLANVSVIQKAIAPINPVKPKKRVNVALALVVGLVSGVGLALLAESASESFTTPEQLENRLGLPVLTAIAYKEG